MANSEIFVTAYIRSVKSFMAFHASVHMETADNKHKVFTLLIIVMPALDFFLPTDESVPLERFDRILNETARRLSMLRGSVESPQLGLKIENLHLAAKEQQSQMSTIDQDLQEIQEERDSLRDIASNLPQACRSTGQAGRG